MNVKFRLGQAYDRVRAGDVRHLFRLLRNRVYSDTLRVGIRKDLANTEEAQSATDGPQIRIASMADIEAVLDPGRGGATDANELWQRRLRRHVAATLGPNRCYVADSGDLGPSFMQFLFFPEDNDAVQAKYPDIGPPVQPGEAMVEYVYVSPDARSLPFVTKCLVLVADEARRRGATSVITYAPLANKAALLSTRLAGYRPFAMRRLSYRFFRRRVSYEPYTDDVSGDRPGKAVAGG